MRTHPFVGKARMDIAARRDSDETGSRDRRETDFEELFKTAFS